MARHRKASCWSSAEPCMCRLLHVHPSGFYAWLKNPSSRRANEDNRKIDLLLKAREESRKVSGYRKLHDDLIDRRCHVVGLRAAA